MGKVIAGLCCFIVGVQVLVGVPLAVCLAFFALTGGGPPVAFESYSTTLPPPSFVGSPLPTPLPPALDEPGRAAIAESRDRIGSPLEGTLLDAAATHPEEADFGAALQAVSHDHVTEAAAVGSIDDELQEQSRKLAELATQLEERGQFQQAAKIRELTAAIEGAGTKKR
jgi:hypothetical protein